MGLVDDIVPHGEVGIALNALAVGGELFVCFPFVFSADQLCIRQDSKLERRILDSGGEGTDTDGAFALPGQFLHFRQDQHVCSVLMQKFLQHLRPALISRKNHHTVVLLPIDLQILRRGLGIARVGGKLLGRNAEKRLRLEASSAEGEGIARIEGEALQFLPDLIRRETEALRLEGAESVPLQGAKVLSQLLPVFLCHLAAAGRLIHKDDRVLRDIVKPGCRRIEQREPPVQIRHIKLIAEFLRVLPERCGHFPGRGAAPPLLIPLGQFLHLPAQGFRPAGCQGRQRLRRGKNSAFRDGLVTALTGDVEIPHGVDLIAPEFHAHRLFLRRGKEVEDSAAARKLAGALHLFRALISAADEGLFQVLDGIGFRRRDGEGRPLQQFLRHGSLQHGRDGSHRHGFFALLCLFQQGREEFQALLFHPA